MGNDVETSPVRTLPAATIRFNPNNRHMLCCPGYCAPIRRPGLRGTPARCRPGARPVVPGPASPRYRPFLLLDRGLPYRIVFTVTELMKVIGGVRTRVIFNIDFSKGKLVEKELAFFAQESWNYLEPWRICREV